MAGLFRRLRREKAPKPREEEPEPEVPAEEEPVEGMPEPEGDLEQGFAGPPASPELEPAPPPAPTPAVTAVSPSAASVAPERTPELRVAGPPPPLPLPEEKTAGPSVAQGPGRFIRCFLCGTRLDGPWCPTCHMAWND